MTRTSMESGDLEVVNTTNNIFNLYVVKLVQTDLVPYMYLVRPAS